jgi:hypothetical protein
MEETYIFPPIKKQPINSMTPFEIVLLFVFISLTLGGVPTGGCAQSNALDLQNNPCDDLIVVQRLCEACTGKIEEKIYFDFTPNFNNNTDDKFLYFYACVSNNHMKFEKIFSHFQRNLEEFSSPISIYFRRLIFKKISRTKTDLKELEEIFEKDLKLGERGHQENFWNINSKAIKWAQENYDLKEKNAYMFETLDLYLIALRTWLQTCPKLDKKEIHKLLAEAMKVAKDKKTFSSNGFEAVVAEEKDMDSSIRANYKSYQRKLTKFYINLVTNKFPLEHCTMDDFITLKNHWDSLIKKNQKDPKNNLHPMAWYHEFSRKFDPSARIDQMLNEQKNSCQKNPPNCPTNWNAKYEIEKKKRNEEMIDPILKEENLNYSTIVLEEFYIFNE